MTSPPSSLLPGYPNRVTPSPSPNLFSPDSHTHVQHRTIPADRSHISLSDPVLAAAAEKRLSSIQGKRQRKRSIIRNAGTIKTAKPGYLVLHLDSFPTLSPCDDGFSAADTASPPPRSMDIYGAHTRYGGTTEARGAMELDHKLLKPSDDRCDISEVMTIGMDGTLSDAGCSAPDNSRYGSGLAPLASEIFREELYARGYLERPASQPPNVTRKSITGFMLASRSVFPKVLGRRQGRKVAECMRMEQEVTRTAGQLDRPEKKFATSIASVALRVPHIESPGTNSNTSVSETFDLHELSYITAFTTPPSSPSIVLDAGPASTTVSTGYDDEEPCDDAGMY